MEEDILNYLYQLSCFVGHPVSKTKLMSTMKCVVYYDNVKTENFFW